MSIPTVPADLRCKLKPLYDHLAACQKQTGSIKEELKEAKEQEAEALQSLLDAIAAETAELPLFDGESDHE